MSMRKFPQGEYRSWRYMVVIVSAPEDRWKFVAQFRRQGESEVKDERPEWTYVTWEEAATAGAQLVRNWIDKKETTPQ